MTECQRLLEVSVELGFLDRMLGFRLKQAYFHMMAGGEERLRHLGISPQGFSVLAVVSQNPKIIQSRLIEQLYITRSSCSDLVEQLIQAGLLRRTPLDRRSNGLSLTAQGKATLDQTREIIDENTKVLTSHMSATEVETLVDLLARLTSSTKSQNSTV